MNLKLTRHGQSFAIVLDDDLLERLQIDEQTPLEVSVDGASLVISPQHSQRRGERFATAISAAGERFAKNFRRLAG